MESITILLPQEPLPVLFIWDVCSAVFTMVFNCTELDGEFGSWLPEQDERFIDRLGRDVLLRIIAAVDSGNWMKEPINNESWLAITSTGDTRIVFGEGTEKQKSATSVSH